MNPNLPAGNQPNFFGRKVSQPGINVNNASDNQLIYKDDFSTQTYYGNNTTNGSNVNVPVMEIGQLSNGGAGIYFPDANGTGVAQFGLFPDGSTALKVSQPGVEVATASNDQLIFNSAQDIFKIIQTGDGTIPEVITSSGVLNSIVLPHGLSFIPIAFIYINPEVGFVVNGDLIFAGNYSLLPYTAGFVGSTYLGNAPSVDSTIQIWPGVDATNIYIGYSYSVGGDGSQIFPAIPYKYYLLQESAN